MPFALKAFTFKIQNYCHMRVYPNFLDWPPGARTENGRVLCH
jgi:hypothetical protein